MTFDSDLADLGFELLQQRRGGTRRYTRKPSPFLTWWVLEHGDGTADLTWEIELGAYLKAKGFTISVQDELSLLLFPGAEVRGPAEIAWIQDEIAKAERSIGSVDLLTGA